MSAEDKAVAALKDVLAMAREIRQSFDHRPSGGGYDNMVVSAGRVRDLWSAIDRYDIVMASRVLA